jgi:phenylacetic acid degradation operon negative regulatory protein
MPPETGLRRKLTARSAILSALLGMHPAQAPVKDLLAIATELGLQESAVRVALTRMVASGDLERAADGVYQLAPRLLDRQRRQDIAVGSGSQHWTGQWQLVVVTAGADDPAGRTALRTALQNAKLAELREGVWTRPNNIEVQVPAEFSDRTTVFTASPEDSSADLAERLFTPSSWADEANALLASFAAEDGMTERFETAAAAVRHLLHDPLLPNALLPPQWPGQALRGAYERFRIEFATFALNVAQRASSL